MSNWAKRVWDRAIVAGRLLLAVAVAILSVGVQPAAAQNAAADGSSALVDVMAVAGTDADSDGLTDTAEKALRTDPLSTDSDSDTLPDSFEVWNGLNPLNFSDASADVDNDGLSNVEEFEAGSLPAAADTDGDAYWDGIEVERGSDPAALESYPVGKEPEDVNCDGTTNAADLQLVINGVLGHTLPVPANVDATDGLDAADVQAVINAFFRR